MPFHALQWGYATYTSGFPFNFIAAISNRERATIARAGLNHFFALRVLVGGLRPEPESLPPPETLLTVAHARASASSSLNPRS